jgi:uncharacterized protein YjbI with pentapeptide repeats
LFVAGEGFKLRRRHSILKRGKKRIYRFIPIDSFFEKNGANFFSGGHHPRGISVSDFFPLAEMRRSFAFKVVGRSFVDIQITDRQNVHIQTTDRQNVDIQTTDRQNVDIQIKDLQNVNIQITDHQNANTKITYFQYFNIQKTDRQNADIHIIDTKM